MINLSVFLSLSNSCVTTLVPFDNHCGVSAGILVARYYYIARSRRATSQALECDGRRLLCSVILVRIVLWWVISARRMQAVS